MTLRFKPEVQAKIDARRSARTLEIRLRTPAEQEEYQRERDEADRVRTIGWLVCDCCTRKKPPGDFLLQAILVCCDCVDRGQRYGRPWRRRVRVPQQATHMWFLNAASAVLKELERECRNIHGNSRMAGLMMPNFPQTLTLSISPKP